MFVIMEHCGGLRGEELQLLPLKGILYFWEERCRYKTPHLMLTFGGRFKVKAGDMWHLLPITDVRRMRLPYDLGFVGYLIRE